VTNPNRVTGQVKVKADGQLMETDGSSVLDLGGPKREPVIGDFQAGAFRETTEPSKLETTILVKKNTSLAAIRAIDNATLTMEPDIGGTYIVRGAYVADVISHNFGDGKAKVVFQGPPAEEVR
jgi:hypothetical protein